MRSLSITSPELSSTEAMDELFIHYCNERKIHLDFSKSHLYNGYLNFETSCAYTWFIKGCFRAIGTEHMDKLVKEWQ